MPGSPWTAENRTMIGDRAVTDRFTALLMAFVVGAAAGLLSACVRLHLGLPGHKAVLLLAPVIAARFTLRLPAASTAGMAAASLASCAASGSLVGAAPQLLFFVLAGAVIDLAASFANRRRLATVWLIPLAALAGLAANMILLLARLIAPLFRYHALPGLSALGTRVFSYALFGLIAGAVGAAAGRVLRPPRPRLP